MKELKKVKVKKEYGEWYYLKYQDGDLDAPIYEIYNADKKYQTTVGAFNQVREYCMADDKEEYIRIYG